MNAEIEENIRKNVPWAQLPAHVKQVLGNTSKEYDKAIISFSIRNQLRFRGNLVRHVFKDEKRYYERVLAYSRERLMLFPYHLADMIVKGLRVTPFSYYISVVEKLLQDEKSYDTLPNFTAADCLRLLGIGRNEYIELMNRSRSNRIKLFGKKNVRGLLPNVPQDIHIEPWWRVEVGLVLEEDAKLISDEQLALVDKLIDQGSQTAGELDYNVLINLYKRGLIYLDVPITAVDRIQVPPLQGFVMNRVLGDYFETLLYKIFVSIDEHTTVGELAQVLQIETELVKQAVSLYCRLQFARKLEPETEQQKAKRHPSWNNIPKAIVKNVDITPLTLDLSGTDINLTASLQSPQSSEGQESPISTSSSKKGQRVAFLFDSTLTAFLMMGNLSPGLKKHAVTMFEVGKLSDESLDSFLSELEKVSVLDAEGEGEARRYFDHAVILRSTVFALRKLESAGLDLVRLESLHSLDEDTCNRLLQKKYKLLVSMAPLSREVRSVATLSPPHLGPSVPEVNSLWFKMFLYHMTGYGPPSLLLIKGTVLRQLPRMFLGYSRLLVTGWLHEPAVIPVANILHVNAALQYSPVLIQAYGVRSPASTQVAPFPFRPDTPLRRQPKINDPQNDGVKWRRHPAVRNLEKFVDLERNCGFLSFANIGVPDFGCANWEPVVRLGRNGRHQANPGSVKQRKVEPQPEITAIVNENFSFAPGERVPSEERLRSPDDSHFALTPVTGSNTSSPANGFTSHECTDLLQQELDKLELEQEDQVVKVAEKVVDKLLSPSDEQFEVFSREKEEEVVKVECGEMWTLLDCQFGVPLFDVNANTKICDMIVYGGLAEESNLLQLTESSRKLGTALLEFISQCQYHPGENMGIIKRGKLTPLPRHNLVFDNGKISEWSGK